jgi:hypothetical protein
MAPLSTTPGRAATYRIAARVRFNHRADELAAQTRSGQAVACTIWFDPQKESR